MATYPNVIWITLDSVRSDHTSLSEYGRDTTPNLQRISDGGSGFSSMNCIAHSSSTHPSSGAILTGKPPSQNTVGIYGDKLPDEIATVPEYFREAGYHTACISRNSYVSSATGLDRGFDRFKWVSASTLHKTGLQTLTRYFLNIRKHSAGFSLDTAKHSTPFLMNDVAKRWLESFRQDNEPFFFYLHYNEPHRPYFPPLPYLDRYTDDIEMSPEEAAEFSVDVHYRLNEIIADGCNLSRDEWDALEAMYDAEIAYTDEMVGRLFDYVKSSDLDETIFVITADHGEHFGEYGLLSHGTTLHDAVVRVPLVIQGMHDIQGGRGGVVQHSDVMKTLLEHIGGEASQVVGVDLRKEKRDYAVSQRGPMDFEFLFDHNPEFDADRFHKSMLTALRTKDFKYQKSSEFSELFELPDEDDDVSEQYPEKDDELDGALEEWLNENGEPLGETSDAEFSDAMRQQLEDLGYLQ